MKRKFLACDVDGTLIHHDQKISTKDLNAIKKFRDAGHYFALCTGRTETWTIPILQEYNLHCDGLILCNGSLLFDVDKKDPLRLSQISSIAIDNAIGKEIINYFYKLKEFTICWDDGKDTYEIDDRLMTMSSTIIQEDSALKKSIKDFQEYTHSFVTINIAPFNTDITVSEQSKKDILSRWGTYVDVFRNQHYIDIAPKSSSKGQGILNMAHHLGEEFELFGIGDSYNDLPMFETVGKNNAFVMKNAEPELKKYSNNIVDSVSDCIEKLLNASHSN
ncbi:MAG: HAD-IIB family hydrolase [Brevinema sp.]